ncbi:Rpn family recombination-promoting nuclease/putative transposase [Trichothermofontia sp.]
MGLRSDRGPPLSMHRDSLFYQIFRQCPALLVDLLPDPPANAADYNFASVAVKEPKFEIDGVFLPPPGEQPGMIGFCEAQFQKDERLYERLFSESFLFFYQNCDQFSDWFAIVIYPSRSIEQTKLAPYQVLLDSHHVHRIYLDELGPPADLPLGLALMVLTIARGAQAPATARSLLNRVAQEPPARLSDTHGIMELITTIMVYKFSQLSRAEVEAMLGITLQETRVYQEAKAEGEQIGEQRGRQEEGRSLVIQLLTRRFGKLSTTVTKQINQLSLEQLENLGEALLDFATIADLRAWLKRARG